MAFASITCLGWNLVKQNIEMQLVDKDDSVYDLEAYPS